MGLDKKLLLNIPLWLASTNPKCSAKNWIERESFTQLLYPINSNLEEKNRKFNFWGLCIIVHSHTKEDMKINGVRAEY